MASKVLVPAAPFTKLQVKKSLPDQSGTGFIIGGNDAVARVAHLEHSVRFLQEQHRLMLSGLHAEIEALRERNRDLQFQLIFNKEASPKAISPATDETAESNEESSLKREVSRLERESGAARGEARAAEARALQLQRMVDAQAEKLRELELARSAPAAAAPAHDAGDESRGELRARLADAERLVRRLRADAERQRREVLAAAAGGAGAGVTNLLFDGAHARHAHLQCMKSSLHASLRAGGLDGFGYQNQYFPAVPADYWREPLREEYSPGVSCARGAGVPVCGVGGVGGAGAGGGGAGGGGRARRPITLPELAGHHIHRSTVYANNHTRPRANGYDNKSKKGLASNGDTTAKSPDEHAGHSRLKLLSHLRTRDTLVPIATYPELRVVVASVIPSGNVSTGAVAGGESGGRTRPRRHHHRKHATDHT